MAQLDQGLNATGSLNAFYDEIVFHEMAKGTNRFFITFEKGSYAIPNKKRESIATMELDYPHVSFQTGSGTNEVFRRLGNPTFPRRGYSYRAFLEEEEVSLNPSTRYQNNGHITTTQLKGNRFFQSTLTSSIFKEVECKYEVYDGTDNVSHISTRKISGSYYWPYTQYQLGVLRNSPTIVLNLNKPQELPEGLTGKGFIVIPKNTNDIVLKNLEYYLEKGGLLEKTTRTKVRGRPEGGGGGFSSKTTAQGLDIYNALPELGFTNTEELDDY